MEANEQMFHLMESDNRYSWAFARSNALPVRGKGEGIIKVREKLEKEGEGSGIKLLLNFYTIKTWSLFGFDVIKSSLLGKKMQRDA